MWILDSNIIIGFLCGHDSYDQKIIYTICQQIFHEKQIAYIDESVCIEVFFVLIKTYKNDKSDVVDALITILEHTNIRMKNKSAIIKALEIALKENIHLVDALLIVKAIQNNLELKTLDKKAYTIFLKYSSLI